MPSGKPISWALGCFSAAALCWAPAARADSSAGSDRGLDQEVPAGWFAELRLEPTTEEPTTSEPPTVPLPPAQAAPVPGAKSPEATPLPAQPGESGQSADQPPPKPLDITADQQGFDLMINRFVATGNAAAVMAGGRLMADRIEYETATRTLWASGSVRFQRGQQYFQASRLRYSLIEEQGELEDVYGVLDLLSSEQDLDVEQTPTVPLPAPAPIACPTLLPPVPDWHPHPWAATLWGGRMFHSDFGQTFFGQGVFRPEYVLGAGVQRRLVKAGPFALELDFTALGHWASAQKGSKYTAPFNNDQVRELGTSGQFFGESTAGVLLRTWLQPWLSVGLIQGVSLNTNLSNYECTYRKKCGRFLNYLGFEVEGSFSPQWSMVGRIHHRSGAFGTYNGVREGSNAYLVGLRYRFGAPTLSHRDPQAAMPPPKGCENRGAEPPERPRSLAEALEQTAMGGTPPDQAVAGAAEAAAPPPIPRSFQPMREQERLRAERIRTIEQRIGEVQAREGLLIERRRGGNDNELTLSDRESDFGPATPPQVRRLQSEQQKQAVQGTLTHLRFQAPRIVLTPTGWRADRASFSNDPFTPAQAWMDADDVLAVQEANGDTVITSKRNRLILEDRLPIPVTSRTRIRKEQQVENRWVLGVDQEDRDGFYVGRRLRPIGIGRTGRLQLEPQFMLERAYQGSTDSYPAPGGQAGGPDVSQATQLGDLFGIEAGLETSLLGFDTTFNLDISSFNPENFLNATRTWGELERSLRLPVVGDTKARLFAAYRFRVWNGTLGDQDVYTAYGASLEKLGTLPSWGRLSNSYFWRVGVGNYQGNEFVSGNQQSQDLARLWRANAFLGLNSFLTLWQGTPLPSTPDGALRYSPVPIVPKLTFSTNLGVELAYFGDGTYQNVVRFSGGPTLTLGHFSKPFLDYTELTITGGIAAREGLSPFTFDRAVDLGTLGIGLTQQLVGPLLFNGGIGVNVDPASPNYGELTGSYVELRWQRRAYAFSVFYSPYEGIGGVRVRLNDFGFSGTGVPFVPYRPPVPGPSRDRPF